MQADSDCQLFDGSHVFSDGQADLLVGDWKL